MKPLHERLAILLQSVQEATGSNKPGCLALCQLQAEMLLEEVKQLEARCSSLAVPHNATTGETLDSPTQVYQTDLWDVAANVPSAGIALQAVLAAVPDIIAYIKSK